MIELTMQVFMDITSIIDNNLGGAMACERLSFSVQENDTENLKLVRKIRKYVDVKGIKLSWLILQALEQYEANNIDLKEGK